MKYIITFIMIGLLQCSFAQIINSRVINENNGAVAYATISILNTHKGSYSDKTGFFSLPYPINSTDTIVICCIGYQNRYLTSSELNEQKTITLQSANYALETVNVVSTKRKLINIKDNKRIPCSVCLTKGSKLVTHINLPQGSTLNEVTFYCQRTKAKRLLAIRVYDSDIYGNPTENRMPINRIIEINPYQSQFNFKLKDLNIITSKYGVFVGVEFIDINKLDTSKKLKRNPYLYFSSKSKENNTYIKHFEQEFKKQQFPFRNTTQQNLQCSYSYYSP